MASNYDATEFIDGDFETHKTAYSAALGASAAQRAPMLEELELQRAEQQRQLAELKREKEERERKLAALEEIRRRQIEFQTGRKEILQNLTRGVGLLEEAEFNSRRDAEQMAKALLELRDSLGKVERIQEETWSKDNGDVELTRALTAIENARLEWNSARLKFPLLSGPTPEASSAATREAKPSLFNQQLSLWQLCRLGLALTWPLAMVAVLGVAALLALVLRR
jgi:hypothetical protein